MKKGFTFKSVNTGVEYTINLPYFNTVLEAEQYILNKMASLSEIVAPLINSRVESRILWDTLDSAIGDEFCAAIGMGATGDSNIPVDYVNVSCRVISGDKMYFYKNNSLAQLDADTYEIADNSYLVLTDTYRLGWGGGNYCSGLAVATTIENSKIGIYNKILCNDVEGRARFNTRFDVLMMACYVELTDGTPTLQLLMIENTDGLCSYGTSGLVGKSASDFIRLLKRKQIVINKPKVEQPTISGDVTDDIDTETGDSATHDSEDNVGGDGHVTLINNVVNYDNYTPNYSRLGTGFITAYEISSAQLVTLHSFLYSETITDMIKNFFAGDASKAIIDLFNIPVAPNVESTSSIINIGVISSGASANAIQGETVTFDFGSIDITANSYYSNSFMDLSPYNQYSIYLPYIGFRNLSTNDVRSINDNGFKIYLKYVVDVLTGDFVAIVEADHNNCAVDNDTGTVTTAKLTKQLINVYNGSMRTDIPLSYRNPLQGLMPIMSGLASTMFTMATASASGATDAQQLSSTMNSGMSVLNNIGSVNNSLMARSDSISGSVGNLSLRTAFIINQECPKYIRTGKSNQFIGYPVYKFMQLNDDRGFIKVRNVIASNFPGTAHEQEMVVSLLKKGVWCK